MKEVLEAFPKVEVFLSLEPEECASYLLFMLKKRIEEEPGHRGAFHLGGLQNEFEDQGRRGQYPRQKLDEVKLALTEAFSYLEAQGLLVFADGTNGANGYRVLSRRGRRFASKADFKGFQFSRLLAKDSLHPRIEEVWIEFNRGDYDGAVFKAMRALEVYVREVSKLGAEWVGTKLMREAFKPAGTDKSGRPVCGVLTDATAEASEQEARAALFAGAIGEFKNPQSHRLVGLDDPVAAIGAIYFANYLMFVVDEKDRANQSTGTVAAGP